MARCLVRVLVPTHSNVVVVANVETAVLDHDAWTPEVVGDQTSLKKNSANFPAENLRRRAAAMTATKPNERQWLTAWGYWYLQAQRVDDPWKKFLWAFLALEVL